MVLLYCNALDWPQCPALYDDDDGDHDDDGNDNGDAWKFLSRNTYDKKIWRHGTVPYSEANQKQPYYRKSYKNHVIILSSLSSHSH